MDFHNLTLTQLKQGLQNGDFDSQTLTRHYLDRVQQSDLNAFITLDEDGAMTAAKQADARRKNGDTSPLLGIPMAHKDNICTTGLRTTCGSKMLANFTPFYNATLAQKCMDAGLVCIGKTNMDEFAMGSDNESSFFGAVKNPHDHARVSGGSSGGSAAAVAAGLVPLATGSDTGGSIRQPASFCGLTGIKPTYGRISRFGMIAYASSFDQAGAFGKSALDCAYLLEAMAGFDDKDSTSVNKEVPNWVGKLTTPLNDKPLAGLKIGIPQEYFGEGLDNGVKAVIEKSLQTYQELGATLVDIDLTDPKITLATYYLLAPAEASSNLSRFDGVRFGYRCENPKDLTDLYTRSRTEGFGQEVQRRILMGTYALSAGYFDAYYVKAQKVRRVVLDDFLRAFHQCDVIATPTAPTTAYKIGEKLSPAQIYLGDAYTIGVNLAGLPALSHPVGFADGLPVGLQLIGKHWDEEAILAAAHAYQGATDFHTQMADLG